MSTLADLVAVLREGLDVEQPDYLQLLFEHWVGEEAGWPLASVALPLLVGIPPEDWPFHLDDSAREAAAAALERLAGEALGVSGDAPVSPLALRAWAQGEGVRLPAAAEPLLDFVQQTVPRLAAQAASVQRAAPDMTAPAREREQVLGAALALVTRFTEDCLDSERMYDPRRIARRMLLQSALWFPDGPPRMGEDGIVALIEPYIRGF